MKHLRGLFAFVVAAIMAVTLAVPALAVGSNTITVDVNFKSQEYSLYKLFDATVNDDREAAVDADNTDSVHTAGIAYTLIDNNANGHALTREFSVTKADGTTATVKGADWFEYVNGSDKHVKIKDNVDITTEEFRLWAAAYGVQQGATVTATQDNDPNVKWVNLDDGYYFLTTTTGTLVTVDSVAPNAIVKDKNTLPEINKTVQEDSLVASPGTDGDGVTAYQKQNDQEIGKRVYFKSVVSAKKGGQGYVVYDKLGKELTFTSADLANLEIYAGSVDAAKKLTSGTDYSAAMASKYYKGNNDTTATEDNLTNGETAFSVTFANSYLNTLTADTDLILLYSATVDSDAVVNTAILNDTTLKYGTKAAGTYTPESETHTYVWGVDVLKHETNNETKALANAQFVLYRTETSGNTTSIYYATFDTTTNKLTGWTAADTTAVADLPKKEASYFGGTQGSKGATILTTGADGTVAVTGLDEGTYYLLEVQAPDGYNKLGEAVVAVVDSTSDESVAETLDTAISAGTANGSLNVKVANAAGTELPSTGGIGTTIFYVVGGILVVGAAVTIVVRRRAQSEA